MLLSVWDYGWRSALRSVTGNSLLALPEALRQIGAAADRSVELLVGEYRRLVSGVEPCGYLLAAGVEEFG